MIILGKLGVANTRVITSFLDNWYTLEPTSYTAYYKKYNEVGEDMILGLKYSDPYLYETLLDLYTVRRYLT